MKKFGLRPMTWRRFVRTTDSRHRLPVYPNLLKKRQVRAVNEVWVADITYIRIRSSFVYLAALPSVITSKPANGYHFKTGHRTSVRDKSLYSFGR
jgi:putative transposase